MAKKKHKKIKKIFSFFSYVAFGLVVFWLVFGIFLFFSKPKIPPSVYVYPENPKQGDTVFIKVSTQANNVVGSFEDEKLVFYKKLNSQDWISFLGVDADQKPGDYKISVNAGGSPSVKEIKVSLASFSGAPVVLAPSSAQIGVTAQRAVDNIRKNDNPVIYKILDNLTPKPYFSSSFSFPLSSMQNSGFSFGKFINFGKYALQHLGVDLRAPKETEIFSVNDGKVVATLELSNYGKTVIIDHGLDIFSLYLHLDQFKVSVGQMVKKGQTIGLSGDTGYVTAPHLHFSMRVDGARVDPVVFIETSKKIDENPVMANISGAFSNVFNFK